MRKIELLAPAANKHVAIEAILHGADAVYIGAPSHGARKNVANSIEDIRELVKFAHQYDVRIYVTVNTLVYDNEIADVEKMIGSLYEAGVDALIVQDMGILRMNIPPIALHASTQCDNRDLAKIKFLESAGFSQIVLARELSLEQIKDICRNVDVPVECFVHGALCVSYSGRCRASYMSTGRSANRGECSQMCRFKYTLTDADNKMIVKDRYLLSLRDFNASDYIGDMLEAGVSSFKIEGRLKDASYVKNITAYYRRLIDRQIALHPDRYKRSSKGESTIDFIPDPNKSFNRGFTSYFIDKDKTGSMASLLTPKSMGETITNVGQLNNGDGISFFNSKNEYEGVLVNRIRNGRIIGSRPFVLPHGVELHRTLDRNWQNIMDRPTATRKLWVDITIDDKSVGAVDERGNRVTVSLDVDKYEAKNIFKPENILGKLGNTVYSLRNFQNNLEASVFIPASQLSKIKSRLIKELDLSNESRYKYEYRLKEDCNAKFPVEYIDGEYNVANNLAESFYREHGTSVIGRAIEVSGERKVESPVMYTRYCIRRELGMCKKNKNRKKDSFREPFYLVSGNNKFRINFDCTDCGMTITV